jgi:tungstate transport system ATP-binding protein
MAEATPAAPLLRAENLTYDSGATQIIRGVSLALTTGPRTVVLGANGAGKSVLMRLLHGLLAPASGRIEWSAQNGRPANQAMVFQRAVMLRRSAMANVRYALDLSQIPPADRWARAAESLRRAGLQDLAHRPARVLSGGEQQRLALARAWAIKPDVLFLDEPTASLDPAATREVENAIQDIHEGGTKIVMTTHNLGQARRLADEIVFVHEGRLTEHTPALQFFKKPQSSEAAAFLKGELP